MTALFPGNVGALTDAGIDFKWVKSSHHLVTTCACGGKLFIDEEKPFAWCYGLITCRVADLPFPKMLAALKPSTAVPIQK